MTAICIASKCLAYNATLGGHIWVYLNWALGCQLAGYDVVFLEALGANGITETTREAISRLHGVLKDTGLNADISLIRWDADQSKYIPECELIDDKTIHLQEAVDNSDLLLDFLYDLPADIICRFHRSALIDIDPGLLQMWINEGQLNVASHDFWFTIGESIGKPGSLIPDCGQRWGHTHPPVALESWPIVATKTNGFYTTVTNWWGDWVRLGNDVFNNEKRTSFIECIDLPSHANANLELAIFSGPGMDADIDEFTSKGWKIRKSEDVSDTPQAYRSYIQNSRGEFSCAKPSCIRFQNAWISDRTLCYLASGKPAIVQHTGESQFLPNGKGLFRFRTPSDAIEAFQTIEADYETHARHARALVEEYFEAEQVVSRVLERAL